MGNFIVCVWSRSHHAQLHSVCAVDPPRGAFSACAGHHCEELDSTCALNTTMGNLYTVEPPWGTL